MKKGIVYTLLIAISVAVAAFVIVKNKMREDSFLPMKERSGSVANSEEYKINKKKADELLAQIKQKPEDVKPKLELASLYIQEGRVTGDHLYYDAEVLKLTKAVLTSDSNNFEANVFKGIICLSQHHFSDGLKVAGRVRQLNPYNAFVYGMLTDANVELGTYEEAVANADKMISIRPDIRSYSRVSYLREIYGDYPGAVEAMKLAVSAGYPGEEGTEWARVHLGQLHEFTGDLQSAEMQYTIALQERPDYPYALAGLGRIARSNKNYKDAIRYFQKSDSLVNDFALKDELTDLYALNGEQEKSAENAKEVIKMLERDSQKGISDENAGHYSDRELAYAYLKTGNFALALAHAEMEYNRRPDNIDVNETLAWVNYKKGDFRNAKKYITVALRTNSKNPTLLCRAGLILNKNGETAKAKELIKEAIEKHPPLDEKLLSEALEILDAA